jgi:hypothetical protein
MRVVDSIKFVSPDGSGVVTALETFTSAPATDDVMRPVPLSHATVSRAFPGGTDEITGKACAPVFDAQIFNLVPGDVSGEPCDEQNLVAACDEFARLVRAEMGVYFGLTDCD